MQFVVFLAELGVTFGRNAAQLLIERHGACKLVSRRPFGEVGAALWLWDKGCPRLSWLHDLDEASQMDVVCSCCVLAYGLFRPKTHHGPRLACREGVPLVPQSRTVTFFDA